MKSTLSGTLGQSCLSRCRAFKPQIAFILLCLISCKTEKVENSYFDFAGHQMYYEVEGESASTLLFIHGWGCDLHAWKEQRTFFKEKAKLIFVDLPGFGKSSKNAQIYSIDLFAKSLQALLKHLEVDKVHLVGHSLGHPVAKRIAEDDPDLVKSISIVDGVYFDFPEDEIAKQEYVAGLEGFASMFTGADRTENTKAFVNSLFVKTTPDFVKSYTDTTMLRVTDHVGSSTMENLIKETVWAKNLITIPTLAVYANIPELPSNNDSLLRVWYPQLEYQEIDGAGHFLMMEKPKDFNAILWTFLTELHSPMNDSE